VANSGTAAIAGWNARFTFPNGQVITQFWSATVTQGGAGVTATNLSWNGSLAPGASTAFGFIANWSGTNGVPATTCTAGWALSTSDTQHPHSALHRVLSAACPTMMSMAGRRPKAAGVIAASVVTAVTLYIGPTVTSLLLIRTRTDARTSVTAVHIPSLPGAVAKTLRRPVTGGPVALAVADAALLALAVVGLTVPRPRPAPAPANRKPPRTRGPPARGER
jgi:hypothetical protein